MAAGWIAPVDALSVRGVESTNPPEPGALPSDPIRLPVCWPDIPFGKLACIEGAPAAIQPAIAARPPGCRFGFARGALAPDAPPTPPAGAAGASGGPPAFSSTRIVSLAAMLLIRVT